MKRNLFTIVAAAAATCAFAGIANAQSNLHLRATIPFQFTAENKTFSPGVYEITEVEASVIELRNVDDRNVLITRTMEGIPEKGAQGKSLLVFHRYGGSYFLSQITVALQNEAKELHVSPAEKEWLASKQSKDTVVVSMASARTSGN